MDERPAEPLIRERLRTPQAAAYAGIVFALLSTATMVLIQNSIPLGEPYRADWLDERRTEVQVGVTLVPFAGIAFLWFMGVIRDRIGEWEDKLFSTVYLGSGILFLGGFFVWAALIGAILASADSDQAAWSSSGAFVFGVSMIEVLGGAVTLRMAAVFMFSTATVWFRTKLTPRWLVWLTWALAVTLLIGGASVRQLRLAFPTWVLIVSLVILRAGDELTDVSS